ncbi:MAG: hypothetical protein AAF430_08420 [Myxococcota bacterium]
MAWPGSATGIAWGMGCLLLGMASVGKLDAPASPDLDLPEQPLRRIFERVSPSPAALLTKQPGGGVVTVSRRGVERLDPDGGESRRIALPDSDGRARAGRFTAIHVDPRGALWLGTEQGAVFERQDSAWLPRSSVGRGPKGPIRAIASFGDDRWVVSDSLWRVGPEGIWMRVPLPTLAAVDAFAADPEAGVLAASGGRVWRYDAAGWRAIWRSTGTTPDVLCLALGPEASAWIGTDDGLAEVDASGEVHWSLRGERVTALAPLATGAFAISDRRGLVTRFAGAWRQVTSFRELALRDVAALAVTEGGSVWLARGHQGTYVGGFTSPAPPSVSSGP